MEHDFRPIFVVGYPRSGTTMLAGLLSRHREISFPPETMFFFETYDPKWKSRDKVALVRKAMRSKRIRDLKITEDQLLRELEDRDCTMRSLLAAIMQASCNLSKKKRPGEKTPLHLYSIDKIIEWFPKSKIIAIVRDGRDVVASIMRVPWSHKNIYKHCFDWCYGVELAQLYSRVHPDRVMITKYEDVISETQAQLEAICAFIEEPYDENMLIPTSDISVVPEWERGWKGKALQSVDSSNVEKWRKLDIVTRDTLNTLMADTLSRNGFCTEPVGSMHRAKIWGRAWPYHRAFRPLFSRIKRLMFARKARNE